MWRSSPCQDNRDTELAIPAALRGRGAGAGQTRSAHRRAWPADPPPQRASTVPVPARDRITLEAYNASSYGDPKTHRSSVEPGWARRRLRRARLWRDRLRGRRRSGGGTLSSHGWISFGVIGIEIRVAGIRLDERSIGRTVLRDALPLERRRRRFVVVRLPFVRRRHRRKGLRDRGAPTARTGRRVPLVGRSSLVRDRPNAACFPSSSATLFLWRMKCDQRLMRLEFASVDAWPVALVAVEVFACETLNTSGRRRCFIRYGAPGLTTLSTQTVLARRAFATSDCDAPGATAAGTRRR